MPCAICSASRRGLIPCCWAKRKFWARCATPTRSRSITAKPAPCSTACSRRARSGQARSQSETEIGTRPVSVAFAGVKLAERIFGKLNNHRALIVGAGATSEQVVRHLCDRGIKQLRVLNRTAEHAVDLAARFGGEVVPWENLAAALDWPDLIVTSVSSNEPILTRAMIERAMAARGNRALLLIDLGVPRNVAADVGDSLQHLSV